MPRIVPRSLKGRMIALFLIVTLIPVSVVTAFSWYNSREVLMEVEFEKLTAEVELKKEAVCSFFRDRIHDLETIGESEDLAEPILEITRSIHDLEQKGNGSFDPRSADYTAICTKVESLVNAVPGSDAYCDFSLIWGDAGLIFCTKSGGLSQDAALNNVAQMNRTMGDLWAKVLKNRTVEISDMHTQTQDGSPKVLAVAPLPGDKSMPPVAIALEIDVGRINALVRDGTGLGNSGETYLVGSDLLMRSSARFEKEPSILRKRVDTDPVHLAMETGAGTTMTRNSDGDPVLSAFSPVGLIRNPGLDFDWVVVSDIATSEAFAAMNSLGSQIFCGGAVLLVFACLAGYFAARSISRPMEGLTTKVASLAGEITSTASHLAAGAAETSTSISEITTTMEEVRQTAHLSNEKSKNVADRAGEVAQISENGQAYTANAGDGMAKIREEMEYVAESIIKLSEQTQSIGEIIGSVNDLADQSNLLSVNASIEAAKAGEYGKGFAVVAQEVKSLADQSKRSTEQVRSILNDIQNATSAAVMATERGSKAVESGVELSAQAGDSISILATSVKESEDAAIQIASTSQEQLIGIDQVADSMEHIRVATTQNVDGANQLAGATAGLNDLGQQMKKLAGISK